MTTVRRARKAPAMIPLTDALLRRWSLPDPVACESKEDRGQALIIGGSREVPGAALLAAIAAMRAGAGKLQVATVRDVAVPLSMQLPEARVIATRADRSGEIAGLESTLRTSVRRSDAIVIGPGSAATRSFLAVARAVLRAAQSTVVLDAGAIAAADAAVGADRRVVITPHHGELASLLGISRDAVAADAPTFARALARERGVVVVLKSPLTYIATPDGRAWQHDGGVCGLGTSGSGDVLSGLIGGLAARGATPEQAAAWAVRLHARAGEVLARRIGPVGFLAREIPDCIPALMRSLDGRRPKTARR
jgi:ADP-dependent NAD(P)H-hydrate dehydratase